MSKRGMIGDVTWWSADEYQRFRDEILDDFEDDVLGVYEVWWTANTRFPKRSVSDRLALAEVLVSQLVVDGTVRLYRGEWIGPTHEREALPDGEVDSILREWQTWAPQDARVVWMDRRSM
jgi:hypothetical protein